MYIARQPIFDKSIKVYGYELLYRAGEKSQTYDSSSSEKSTATVLGGLFELGLDQLVANKKAFVNFDDHFLMSDSIELINANSLVIEILEDTPVTETLLQRIANLKAKGYKIALDDFAENFEKYPIVPITDIIKYDIMITPLDTIEKDVKQALRQNKILLAEKIETREEFQKAFDMGFHLFQGYFFSKPSIIGGLLSKKTTNTVYQRIIAELHKPEPSYHKIAEIVSTDVNMAYRVMKAGKKLGDEDISKTIQYALVKMGLHELERWINILMLQELSAQKPFELVRLSLLRSKFGELIATNSSFRSRRYEISLMGLFSVLDAMLDQPMELALEGVSISNDVKDALIFKKGALIPISNIITAYENGHWNEIPQLADAIHIKQEKLYELYLQSIEWTNNIIENFGFKN
jgi:EAL and modified HD-GYP domain-containing signal transduction protein